MNSITLFLFFIPILGLVLLGINLIFAPHNAYQEKSSTFECGFHSFLGQNRTQFSISFFVFALLFLVFDLELVLALPGLISMSVITVYGVSVMIIFFTILTVGFAFELGKKALNIDSRQYINNLKSQNNLPYKLPSMPRVLLHYAVLLFTFVCLFGYTTIAMFTLRIMGFVLVIYAHHIINKDNVIKQYIHMYIYCAYLHLNDRYKSNIPFCLCLFIAINFSIIAILFIIIADVSQAMSLESFDLSIILNQILTDWDANYTYIRPGAEGTPGRLPDLGPNGPGGDPWGRGPQGNGEQPLGMHDENEEQRNRRLNDLRRRFGPLQLFSAADMQRRESEAARWCLQQTLQMQDQHNQTLTDQGLQPIPAGHSAKWRRIDENLILTPDKIFELKERIRDDPTFEGVNRGVQRVPSLHHTHQDYHPARNPAAGSFIASVNRHIIRMGGVPMYPR